MTKKIFFLGLVMFVGVTGIAQPKHNFEIKGGNFVYDGKVVQIHSGEMHFASVPKATY